MKINEAEQKRINEGMNPEYITNRGKLLWADQEHYDDYASIEGCKRLIDAKGKFWGYSDNPKVEIYYQ